MGLSPVSCLLLHMYCAYLPISGYVESIASLADEGEWDECDGRDGFCYIRGRRGHEVICTSALVAADIMIHTVGLRRARASSTIGKIGIKRSTDLTSCIPLQGSLVFAL
jgi:hypothetical protein